MEKLENENVSLDFQIQSLVKERENIKLEYQKFFDSIKKTCAQTQGEIDELVKNMNQKTYAYAGIRAQNQDLLITISELKAMLKTVEKGKYVNTNFDKHSISNKLLCVTPINKQNLQTKKFILKIEDKHVLSKPITLQNLTTKKTQNVQNNNVIASGMYKIHTENNQQTKSVLHSTGLKDATSVRRPSSRGSSSKNSVLLNTKEKLEDIVVHVRTNKNTNVVSKKDVMQTKKIVTKVDVKNALKAKDVICVSCAKNVLIPCHDTCLAKYKLSMYSNVRRTLFTTPRTAKPKTLDSTPESTKTRFTLVSPINAEIKDSFAIRSTAFLKKTSSLSIYMRNKIKTNMKWQKWYETQPNVVWTLKKQHTNAKPSVDRSRKPSVSSSNTSVTIRKWIAKLCTSSSVVFSCTAGSSNSYVDC
ncbi:hypothetical protein Tco_1089377 [Tanacetum coccineum]